MADSEPINIVVEGGGFTRIVPMTVNGNVITGFTTASVVDLIVVEDEKSEFANARETTEYVTALTTTNVTLRAAKSSKTLDAVSGNQVASGTAGDKFTCKASIATAKKTLLKSIFQDGKPVVVAKSAGRRVDTLDNIGTQYLMGYADGVFSESQNPEIQQIDMSFAGYSFTSSSLTCAQINTALSGFITPLGETAVTLTALDAPADVTCLLSGQICEKLISED